MNAQKNLKAKTKTPKKKMSRVQCLFHHHFTMAEKNIVEGFAITTGVIVGIHSIYITIVEKPRPQNRTFFKGIGFATIATLLTAKDIICGAAIAYGAGRLVSTLHRGLVPLFVLYGGAYLL